MPCRVRRQPLPHPRCVRAADRRPRSRRQRARMPRAIGDARSAATCGTWRDPKRIDTARRAGGNRYSALSTRSAVAPGQSAGPTASRQARSTTGTCPRGTLREAWHHGGIRHAMSKIGRAERRVILSSTLVSAVSDVPVGSSSWKADAEGRVLDSPAVPAGHGFEHDSNVCPGFHGPPRHRQYADLGRW